MANENKKYVEVFNDGTNDLQIRDAEAWLAIQQLDPAEVATVAEATAAANELT